VQRKGLFACCVVDGSQRPGLRWAAWRERGRHGTGEQWASIAARIALSQHPACHRPRVWSSPRPSHAGYGALQGQAGAEISYPQPKAGSSCAVRGLAVERGFWLAVSPSRIAVGVCSAHRPGNPALAVLQTDTSCDVRDTHTQEEQQQRSAETREAPFHLAQEFVAQQSQCEFSCNPGPSRPMAVLVKRASAMRSTHSIPF
jgi:hypothetical protein